MGKLLEFPKMKIIDGETGEVKEGRITQFVKPDPVGDAAREALEFLGFKEKPAAKSSTSVMKASVCQKCGCKMDGKIAGGKIGCTCACHKGRV